MSYFSDRELGERPRTSDQVSEDAWRGLQALIESKIAGGWFGLDYPDQCPDGQVVCGTNRRGFTAAIRAEVPGLDVADTRGAVPPTPAALDAIEFCYRVVAKPTQIGYHDYHRHHHLRLDQDEGRAIFREEVNRLLARQGLALELAADGRVVRLGAEGVQVVLGQNPFNTGDPELDGILEDARRRYKDPDLAERKIALEKLWDAFERIKTLEDADKRTGIRLLMDKAATEPHMRQLLEDESRALTEIGNEFRIRHHESTKVEIAESDHVDALFHRMLSFVWLVLRRSGRLR